jgi:amino acid adenylation domain-containing protein
MLIHELFARQVARRPNAIAVLSERGQLSYSELDAKAERLAVVLREAGVKPDVPVGLRLPRSEDFIVAIVGILKAGGGYVPLDPASPRPWLEAQLQTASVPIVVTSRAYAESLPGDVRSLVLEDLAPDSGISQTAPAQPSPGPDNLAYVMYTSGSTGQPKAVAVPHGAVVRLVTDQEYVAMGPGEVFLFHSPPTFDASTFEIWGALLNGGRVGVAGPGVVSIGELARLIRDYQVTTAWLTAALFSLVVDEDPGALQPLRQLLAGGEAVPAAALTTAHRLLPGTSLKVGYGPTETTVFATTYPVEGDGPVEGVPIGRAIGGTATYILDEYLRPVPPFTEGELCVAGEGLAWGYLGAADKTAERFVPDPYSPVPGGRLYKTGDRARWLADGVIEFCGRLDDEVKIRGHRIDPVGVEQALLTHPDVVSAYVTAEKNAARGTYLVAYLSCSEGSEVDQPALRRHAMSLLPAYLCPDVYIVRRALPLTAHGKLDRRRLLDSDRARPPRASHPDSLRYEVAVNGRGQYALWPAGPPLPAGWTAAGPAGSRDECLAHVRRAWPDIRPAHPRQA